MCIESGDTKAPDRKTAGEKPDAGLLNEGPLSSPPPNVPTIFTSQLPYASCVCFFPSGACTMQ